MNCRYVRALTEAERSSLEALWKCSRSHLERVRAHIVLLSAQWVNVSAACQITGFARSSAARALAGFEARGTPGLLNPPRSGRRPRCSKDDEQFLLDLLPTSPRDSDYATNIWTTQMLSEELADQRNVDLKPDGVRDLLHRLGTRQVRVNHYLAKADEAEKGGRSSS